MSIGARIRILLEKQGITQTELAKRLDISVSTLNGYVNDYREPDIQTLSQLARELQTTTDYLIDGEPQPNPYREKVKVIAHNEGVVLTKEQEAAVTRFMKFLIADEHDQ